MGHSLRLTLAGRRDPFRPPTRRKSYYIGAVGAPGNLAAIVTPDALPGFENMNPPGSTWRNEVSARVALTLGFYRPGAKAAKIQCPILYAIGEHDLITPARFASDAANRAPLAGLKSYPCGHFGVYVSPLWERVVADQIAFHGQLLSRWQVKAN